MDENHGQDSDSYVSARAWQSLTSVHETSAFGSIEGTWNAEVRDTHFAESVEPLNSRGTREWGQEAWQGKATAVPAVRYWTPGLLAMLFPPSEPAFKNPAELRNGKFRPEALVLPLSLGLWSPLHYNLDLSMSHTLSPSLKFFDESPLLLG